MKLIIVGAGGHAKVCLETAAALGIYSEISILDDNREIKSVLTYPIVDSLTEIHSYIKDYVFFVAIGDNSVRKSIIEKIIGFGGKVVNLINASASLSPTIVLEDGIYIGPGVIVNSSAVVGRGSIINSNAVVEHDVTVSQYVHISPSATLAGGVIVGESTWIGANATVNQMVVITSNVIVGSGSVVVSNINVSGTYIGVPVRMNIKEGDL